jgi:hypothetical protein
VPPDAESDIEEYPAEGADHEDRAFQRMLFFPPIHERKKGQEGHGRPLDGEPYEFAGEELQGLVIGEEIPFRLDVGRCLERVCLNKGVFGEEEVWGEEDNGGEQSEIAPPAGTSDSGKLTLARSSSPFRSARYL